MGICILGAEQVRPALSQTSLSPGELTALCDIAGHDYFMTAENLMTA
jgi:hypothetical protein